ncbi:MAG: universal stress protein [Pseudomonadota bacterium]
MSYKTILVHVEKSRLGIACIEQAAHIAISQQAHLVGAALTGLSQFIVQCAAMPPGVQALPDDLSFLTQGANLALDQFDTLASQAGVESYERRLVDEEAGVGLALQARYSDLVVLGQHDPSAGGRADLAQYVMLHSARPVLMLPYAGQFERVGQRPLLAWDGSVEATRAITAAIPLLRKAQVVTLAVFNPSTQADVHGDQAGADIALFLARHGVTVNVAQHQTELDIGNALLSLAADLNADLLVMGGYGHSRLREMVLGGVTRTVLASMTLPVLMAH